MPKLKQPDSMACWATAATIMLQWKASRQAGPKFEFTIEDVLEVADKNRSADGTTGTSFVELLESRRGLSDQDKPAFLKAVGLVAEWPANYTVKGWASLLKDYGPLWVTTEVSAKGQAFVHAQIVIGLSGDGSYDGTTVAFIDPLDGQEHQETLLAFVRRYEAVIIEDVKVDSKGEPRFQVLHFPAAQR